MNTFSPTSESRFKELQTISEQITRKSEKERENLAFLAGKDQAEKISQIREAMRLLLSEISDRPCSFTALSLNKCWEEVLQIANEFTTSTAINETTQNLTYTCANLLVNILEHTIRYLTSVLATNPNCLSYFQWVPSYLTEMREYINARKISDKETESMGRDDNPRIIDEILRTCQLNLSGYFRGQCAGEILFKREGLSGHFTQSRAAGKRVARTSENSTHTANCEVYTIGNGQVDGLRLNENIAGTLNCMHEQQIVLDARGNSNGLTAPTITGDHNNRVTDYTALICMATQQGGAEIAHDLCPTITAAAGMSGNNQPVVCYSLDRASFNQGKNAQFDIGVDDSGIAHTLAAKGPGAVVYGIDQQGGKGGANFTTGIAPTLCSDSHGTPHAVAYSIDCRNGTEYLTGWDCQRCRVATTHIVRRLTPTECARLQGMPDWWCSDVPHSDSAEYKMWGNGMALPCVLCIMQNIASASEVNIKA
jgi:hypothetical protein